MNIGQAATASGVSAKMIRYYEQIGLIPHAGRTASGYRDYGDSDLHVLRFVRRARDLGFSVAEIGDLLSLWRDPTRQSADVQRIALQHIEGLKSRIRDLQGMADTLGTLVDACHGDNRPDCPILEGLQAPLTEGAPTVNPRRGAITHLSSGSI